ncbi:SusC/RagA family TonB-linked outer membrane protein [Sphingobacterium athyrii]|uniref:SusC/RagA family TonB-linked outer membrane protein n=1 Tax=Sphingobacterium athyrii TaxID=2152717 RepID=A0A363NZQ2_9SPHI|nr:SusC/RagA family TonB-linked outer membrane protein [Sphingobacterium athyrii]PUV26168.1 SusC/RagA family TonB-linked outer membrane protein [Sphingobacterium athyrii]
MKEILKMHLRVLGIVFMLLLSHHVFSQIKISGTVMDSEKKVPLAGVTVVVVGAQGNSALTSVQTDAAGKFTITANEGVNLKATMIGYNPITVVAKQGVLIAMVSSTVALDETVVVGYTTQKKGLLAGSVASVKFKEADIEIPTTSVGNLLAGRMPGLYVSTPSGVPGAQPNIRIRTASSWNASPTLYVIDGKVTIDAAEFNNLSPNEIEEVSILKDAATTAAYGARAGAGVVLVTTKRGKAGKVAINYSVNTGRDVRGKNMELTSIMEWGQIQNRIWGEAGGPANTPWTETAKAYFKDRDFGGGKGYGFDHLKDVYVNPSITTHNLSASGGTDKLQYFIGASYVNQETFIKNTNEKKYNVRTNITANLTKNVSVFAGLSLNNNKFNSPEGDWTGDMFPKLLLWQPYMPSFTATGLPVDYFWISNKSGEAQGLSGYNKSEGLKSVVNLSLTYKMPFLEGLSAKVGYIKTFNNSNQKIYSHPFTYYQLAQIEPVVWDLNNIVGERLTYHTPGIQKLAAWNQEDQINLQLNFERDFGQHHVNAALVYERQERSYDGIDAKINGFPIYMTDQWWASTGGSGVVGGTATKSINNSYGFLPTVGRKSYIGQFAYDYADKYVATFTYRYDGSANFPKDKRWGFFPSVSAAWVISKENFFKNVNGIESLKVRASVGLTGNDFVAINPNGAKDDANAKRWQYEDKYVTGNNVIFGETPTLNPGIQYDVLPNANITWEKYLNKNFGVDISFLKHFNATAEYWETRTYDILSTRIQSTPPTFSRPLPSVNYGEMKANGIDLSVNYMNRTGDLNYNIGLNFTYGNSWYTIRDLNITYDYQNLIGNGRSANMITGYKVDRMLRNQADVDALLAAHPGYNFKGNAPKPGQFAYKDFNGDNTINENDITVLNKSNNPKVLGLNLSADWKGLSITANFNGSLGYKKSFNNLSGGVEWNRMWRPWANESWSPENTDAWLPYRYSANDEVAQVNTSGSNFWLADASFVRLKFLNIAYNLPQRWYKKYANNIRFYVSGSNLFVISKFNKKFYDPEMDAGTSFPIVKSFNAGVSLTF